MNVRQNRGDFKAEATFTQPLVFKMGKFISFVLVLFVVQITGISAQDDLLAKANTVHGRLLTPAEGCGITDKMSKPKIVGGMDAKPGAFPWIALLGYIDLVKIKISHSCGGALITSRHILTAAHCIDDNLSYVRLGEHDLTTTDDGEHEDISIAKKEMHESFNNKTMENDIAILTLSRDVTFTNRIRPVCLPESEPNLSKEFLGHTPFIAGWGATSENGGQPDVLQMNQFDNRVMCAGSTAGGKDTCQGDSGGPLMLPIYENGQFPQFQIGVVSYGIGCARPGIPGVYTRVQSYMDWIKNKIAN